MLLIQDGKCSLDYGHRCISGRRFSPSAHSRMLYARLVNILLYHYLCVLLLRRLPTLVLCMVTV